MAFQNSYLFSLDSKHPESEINNEAKWSKWLFLSCATLGGGSALIGSNIAELGRGLPPLAPSSCSDSILCISLEDKHTSYHPLLKKTLSRSNSGWKGPSASTWGSKPGWRTGVVSAARRTSSGTPASTMWVGRAGVWGVWPLTPTGRSPGCSPAKRMAAGPLRRSPTRTRLHDNTFSSAAAVLEIHPDASHQTSKHRLLWWSVWSWWIQAPSIWSVID